MNNHNISGCRASNESSVLIITACVVKLAVHLSLILLNRRPVDPHLAASQPMILEASIDDEMSKSIISKTFFVFVAVAL